MAGLKSAAGGKMFGVLASPRDKVTNNNIPRFRNDPIGYTGTGTTTTGSSGSGKKTGGSAGTLPGVDPNATHLAYLQEIERRQQRAAQDAYDRNVASMQSAFAQRGQMLKDNLDFTLKNLQTDYNASRDSVNRDAGKSLQEAYINNMLSRKNLAQNMSAQGLSGGASETTMAGMENNYGNARNNIQTTANENLGSLEDLYGRNRNSAYQAYNEQLAQDALAQAQYMIQFENDRQNALASAYESQMSKLLSLDPSYITGLAGLVSSQQSYSPVATAANNAVAKINTQQGSGGTGAVNSALMNYARRLKNLGGSADDVIQALGNSTGASEIQKILAQLGYN